MEINIVEFLIIVSLSASLILNTLIKWKVLDHLQTFQGSRWYSPNWLPVDCMYCTSFWLCILIGVVLTSLSGQHWSYYLLSALAQQITIQMVRD